MSLQHKTLLILCLTLTGLVGGAFVVSSRILLSKFQAADVLEAEERIERARDLVLEAISVLNSKTGDWANWDDTYAYMAGRNPGFIRANVTDKSFIEIKANLIAFIAPSKRLVYSQAFDLTRKARRPAFHGLEEHLGTTSPLLDHPDEDSVKTGLILLPEGPLLVAARPILTGEGKGPIRGTLVFGRLLDHAELKRLADLLHHSLTVHRLDNGELTKELEAGRGELSGGKPSVVRPIDARSIAAYTLMADIHGRPAVILRVLGPRPMYGESRSSLLYLLVSLVAVGLGFAAASLVLMKATVLAPLAYLTAEVQQIGAGGGSEGRVRLTGNDELARLATTVNAMLDTLARARKAEQESQRALATLMANLPGLAYRCRNDERWTMEFVSGGALALTGYAPHELIQNARLSYTDLIHPDDRRAVWDDVQAALGETRPFELTYRIRTAAGDEKWVWERGQGVHDGATQALEAIEGFVTDISHQIRTQKQLETVGSVNQEITRELDLHALLGLIARRTTDLVDGGDGSIWLWDEASKTLALATEVPHETPAQRLPFGEGLAGVIAERREGLCVNDYRTWAHARQQILDRTPISAAIGEPLLYRDRLIGVLAVENGKTGRPFGDGAQQGLRLLARQAAIAIENARLHTAALRRSAELEAILLANKAIQASLDLDARLREIVQQAATIAAAPAARILLLDEATQLLRGRPGVGLPTGVDEEYVIPVGESFAGQVAITGEALSVPDVRSDPRLRWQEHASKYGLISYLGLPVRFQGRLLGVLVINTKAPRAYDRDEIAILSLFADQAAIAIEHASLYDIALRRGNQLAALLESTQSLMADVDLRGVLTRIMTAASAIGGSPAVKIALYDPASGTLRVESETGTGTPAGTVMPVEGTLSGLAVRERHPIFSGDCTRDPRNAYAAKDQALGLATSLNLPIVYQDTVLGVVSFNTTRPRVYTAAEIAVLQAFAGQAAIAIEHARLFAAAHQAMDDVQRAQAELVRSETLRGLGQMAAGIAHDLNNTLATILGQVELQKLRAPEPAAREGLALLETAALDGAHTVQRLPQFARPRGTSPLEPVDLTAVVQEVVEITSPRWKDEPQRHGLTIRLVLELPELPKVVANPPELREIVTNLIFNSVDAMPHGGTLTLSASADADAVTLTVRDTGIGMPPEIQARVFEPFFTTKGVRGTGLGLASVYGIVERFGGRIVVTSAVGQGTTMTLTFRRCTDAAAVETAKAALGPACRRRVLVVDDEPAVRKTVAALLQAMDHHVTEAPDGAAALRIVAEAAPDLVVTDLGMPEMNGWEVARAVKASNATLPVVLLTGWQDATPGTQSERESVDRVLGKPVRLDALQRVVAELTAAPPSFPA